MRKFRGNKVIGWKTVTAKRESDFDEKVNELMDKYDFEDYQFSTTSQGAGAPGRLVTKIHYSASILLREKQ